MVWGGTDTIDYTNYGSPAFAITPDGSATGTGGIVSIEIALGISGSQPPESPSLPSDPEPEEPVPSSDVILAAGSAVGSEEHVSQQGRYMAGSEQEEEESLLGDLLI